MFNGNTAVGSRPAALPHSGRRSVPEIVYLQASQVADAVGLFASGSRILSFMYLHPPDDNVCRAVRHPGTISIGGAFMATEARGAGVGRALLSGVVAGARSAGFERLAVDFETANLPARRFWLRSFTPVCLSFERHLDDLLASSAADDRR